MKRIVAWGLLAALLLSLSACGRKKPAETTEASQPVSLVPQVEENTVGAAQWQLFEEKAAGGGTVEQIANSLSEHAGNWFFSSVTMLEKETQYFSGFDNYQIQGYASGAVYMPVIGSIPFVGYVFALEEGTDPGAFINALNENCNPAWNICVEADEVLVGYYNNIVFFLMSPASIEG